jgi:hypothetical protein
VLSGGFEAAAASSERLRGEKAGRKQPKEKFFKKYEFFR